PEIDRPAPARPSITRRRFMVLITHTPRFIAATHGGRHQRYRSKPLLEQLRTAQAGAIVRAIVARRTRTAADCGPAPASGACQARRHDRTSLGNREPGRPDEPRRPVR